MPSISRASFSRPSRDGQKDVARKYLERVLDFNPDYDKARQLLGHLSEASGHVSRDGLMEETQAPFETPRIPWQEILGLGS
jgi:hypothetical protein